MNNAEDNIKRNVSVLECYQRDISNLRAKYGLDDRGSIPGRAKVGNFSLRPSIKTGSGAHLGSYPTGSGVSFLGGKAAGS
jgi:hypothetical protein